MQPLDVVTDFGDAFLNKLTDLSRAQDLTALACQGADKSVVGLSRGWGKGHGEDG
jgi:hypothetical protein